MTQTVTIDAAGVEDPEMIFARPLSLVRPALAVAAIVGAIVLHVGLQWSNLLQRTDFAWSSFRSYFAGDQLSYMSMVTNAADGRLANVEPFTNTGTNNYPHLYYYVIGTISRITGINPLQAWSVGGLAVQVVLIAAIATTLYVLTRRWWMPILAPLPFLLGTFAVYLQDGNWFTNLSSHAVLWGAFGVFFTLNGETAALSLGSIGMLVILSTFVRVDSVWKRRVLYSLGAACIGLAANVQTYGFLVCVYLAIFVVATYALVTAKRRWMIILSLVLVVAVFLLGPLVAGRLGPLAALAFGLAPALPGIVVLVLRVKLDAILPLVALVVAASPQVIGTVFGLLSKDPFLVYRVSSSKDLGVDWRGIVAALPILLPLLAIMAAGIHRRKPLWLAFPIGAIAAWALTATNDVWGANQEPYRFWLDMFCIVGFTTLPVGAMVAIDYLGARPLLTRRGFFPRRRAAQSTVATVLALTSVAVCGVVIFISSADFRAFNKDTVFHSLMNLNTPRLNALGELADEVPKTGHGLVSTDNCVDQLLLKISSDGGPIASFNAGMAWPALYAEVHQVAAEKDNGVLDLASTRAADVQWLLTDSACTPVDWGTEYAADLTKVDSREYTTGDATATVTLWALKR
ncbi:hypothetical protein [Subtercola frigoramans]|uniref:Glycosyltransferase RgtA/B/C/D-like domain-containing protein n=1 Tax=Subtercola frigoramans TaxID=120298 RepID=A0ABS2L6N1_9MICO|nr:hypothetical protein [Subtercola frigoramans]MBM7472727.1 hypothetical protein [Subtercola frigoramans]